MGDRWRETREERKRDIKETLQRNGMTERQADQVADERSRKACERAINIQNEKEGGRPPEVRSK